MSLWIHMHSFSLFSDCYQLEFIVYKDWLCQVILASITCSSIYSDSPLCPNHIIHTASVDITGIRYSSNNRVAISFAGVLILWLVRFLKQLFWAFLFPETLLHYSEKYKKYICISDRSISLLSWSFLCNSVITCNHV